MSQSRTFVIIVEVKPEMNFVVYHIEYDKELLRTHSEYLFFQDMLRSNMRMKISRFLQMMFERGWSLVSQSQNKKSMFYTMAKDFTDQVEIASRVPTLPPSSPVSPTSMDLNL